MNDTDQALQDITTILRCLEPGEIHISLPTRPPAETWVEPADEEGVMRASVILGEVARCSGVIFITLTSASSSGFATCEVGAYHEHHIIGVSMYVSKPTSQCEPHGSHSSVPVGAVFGRFTDLAEFP